MGKDQSSRLNGVIFRSTLLKGASSRGVCCDKQSIKVMLGKVMNVNLYNFLVAWIFVWASINSCNTKLI